MTFSGFPAGKVPQVPLPEPFFRELLPQIDHLGELKVTLYILWRLQHVEGLFRYLRAQDIAADETFMQGMGETAETAAAALEEALHKAVVRGTLLKADLPLGRGDTSLYFVNTPKGRAAIEAIRQGQWRPSGLESAPVEVLPPRPTIYQMYEENIGPLTPLIAEALREAEETYPLDWIAEAIQLAVEKNVRHWRYAEAILRRWQEEGRYEREHRRHSEKNDYDKYTSGQYSDFIEH